MIRVLGLEGSDKVFFRGREGKGNWLSLLLKPHGL